MDIERQNFIEECKQECVFMSFQEWLCWKKIKLEIISKQEIESGRSDVYEYAV